MRVGRKGRVTWEHAQAVAELVAIRGTEKEACAAMNPPLSYHTWQHWKARNRNAEGFADLVARITGNEIKYHEGVLKHAAAGTGGFTKRDWRASESWLRTFLPRYSPAGATVAVQVNTQEPNSLSAAEMALFSSRLDRLLAEVKAKDAEQAQVVDAEVVPQLPSPVEPERVEQPKKLPPMFVKDGRQR
jgi:hypothetical protein